MNRPFWLNPFVILVRLVIYSWPPCFVAIWLAKLIMRHSGLSHLSMAVAVCLATFTILLMAGWVAVLMRVQRLWNARRKKRTNK